MVIGVDVGGTKVAAALIEGAAVHEAVEHPTDVSSTEALLAGIEAAVAEVSERAGEPDAVGLGLPSQIEFATGTVLSSVNIPLEGVPLREELGARLGVPVFVDNDANCAALAEAQLVPDPPAHHLVMLTLGTGVGGGVVIDGADRARPHGPGRRAGARDPRRPRRPRRHGGGLPPAGLARGDLQRHRPRARRHRGGQGQPGGRSGPPAAEKGRVSGRDAVEAAEDGDAEALALFERLGPLAGPGHRRRGEHLRARARGDRGRALARARPVPRDRAARRRARHALPALWERTTVRLAAGGAEAGVIGAGVLAAQELAIGDTPR